MTTIRPAFRAVILAVLAASPVKASFHLMQIEQVIGGVNGDVTAQAIQLRMRSGFQGLVSQARIRVWDAHGLNPVLIINIDDDVADDDTGDRVLITSTNFGARTAPDAEPDFLMTNLIPASYLAAGSLTFEDDFGTIYWRLSWGGSNYHGSTMGDTTNDNDPGLAPANFGPPFADSLPSTTAQALRFRNAASALSTTNAADYLVTDGAAEFTNNEGASFTVEAPAPVIGDVDGDRDVDLDDHAMCAICMAGPDTTTPPALCTPADFEACDLVNDGRVDLADFADLATLFTN